MGSHKIFTILSDGLLSSVVNFTITVTNQTPYLVTSPINQVVAVFQTLTYNLPAAIDLENMNIGLITKLTNGTNGLPNFVAYNSGGRYYTMAPTVGS